MTRLAWLVLLLGIAALPCAAADTVEFASGAPDVPGSAPVQIRGLLMRPVGEAPAPAMVLLHPCNGLMRPGIGISPLIAAWSATLRAEGYVTLAVDSFSPRGITAVCGKSDLARQAGQWRPADAYGALRWLQAQPFVKPDRIGVMGWSHGGVGVLLTVWSGSRPQSLSAADPQAPGFRAAVAMYPGCRWRNTFAWASSAPLLMLLGEADNWTPAKECQALAAQASGTGAPIEVHVYPGAYHSFDAPGVPVQTLRGIQTAADGHSATIGTNPAARADAFERVPAFLAKHLKN